MDKRKLNWITLIFVLLTVFVVGMMLSNTLRRSSHITLPETGPDAEQVLDVDESGALTVVEIEPTTVQSAIATLSRPAGYRRSIVIEQLWNGGSGNYRLTSSVKGAWTRTDRTMPDGRVRHTITDGENTYIWYNDERDVFQAPAGEISADNEQSIPTYESVLSLPTENIATADYRELKDLRCIYVETVPDQNGYVLRYWVSVDSGLLVTAEKLLEGRVVYRMSSLEADLNEPDESLFALPDGTKLY